MVQPDKTVVDVVDQLGNRAFDGVRMFSFRVFRISFTNI
jgi:hypothetical protein